MTSKSLAKSIVAVGIWVGAIVGFGLGVNTASAKEPPEKADAKKATAQKSPAAKPPADRADDEASAAKKKPRRVAPMMGGAAEALLKRVAKMPFMEQRKATNTYLDKMSDGLAKLKRAIDQARDERDIVKLNCLNDRYLQIRAAMKLTHKMKRRMEKAHQENKIAARNYLFAKILILFEKVEIKLKRANMCDGKSSQLDGKTDVQVDAGDGADAADPSKETDVPGDPDADWTLLDVAIVGPLFRPPLASPNM